MQGHGAKYVHDADVRSGPSVHQLPIQEREHKSSNITCLLSEDRTTTRLTGSNSGSQARQNNVQLLQKKWKAPECFRILSHNANPGNPNTKLSPRPRTEPQNYQIWPKPPFSDAKQPPTPPSHPGLRASSWGTTWHTRGAGQSSGQPPLSSGFRA